MAVQPIPKGHEAAIPYLAVRNANAAIDFYQRAFGAKLLKRVDMPGGMVGHAELAIGDARFMLADEFPDMGFLGPESIGGTPVTLHVYVPDVDRFIQTAKTAGLQELRGLADQFYGDRSGSFKDPFGHTWNFATHIEDVSDDEVERRAAAQFGAG